MLSVLALAVAAASLDPAASRAINEAYGALAASRQAHDVAGMAAAFDPRGLLIDSRPAPAIDGSELALQLTPVVERLKKDGAQVQTMYRIERRTIIGDVAIDAGYANMTFKLPNADPSKPKPQDMIRRFMVTWKRGSDGQWRIIGDASFPATKAQWEAAKPQAGLYYNW